MFHLIQFKLTDKHTPKITLFCNFFRYESKRDVPFIVICTYLKTIWFFTGVEIRPLLLFLLILNKNQSHMEDKPFFVNKDKI